MSGQPWYRHNPRDFLDGIVGMTPDLIGAYIVALDLIYARGGPIPNDQRWLGGVMGCSPRAATALVNRLVEAAKLRLTDGKLSNIRAENELETAAKISRNAAETGANGGRTRVENEAKANKINASAQGPVNQYREDKKREDKKESPDGLSSVCDEAEQIVAEWNGMAKAAGLPQAAKMTPERRSKVRARLAEHGRDVFTEAIRKIGASEFCRGGNFAALDWLTKPANFLKVIEGNYDDRPQRNGHARPPVEPRLSPGVAGGILALKLLDEQEAAWRRAEDRRDFDASADVVQFGARQ